jgi:hypothetical protein
MKAIEVFCHSSSSGLGWFQRGTGYEVHHSSHPIPGISEAKKKWEANPSLYIFLSLQFSYNFIPVFDISAPYESAFDLQPIFLMTIYFSATSSTR